jgi:hypothetical protein
LVRVTMENYTVDLLLAPDHTSVIHRQEMQR